MRTQGARAALIGIVLTSLISFGAVRGSDEAQEAGQVRIPLDVYERMIRTEKQAEAARYAVGSAAVAAAVAHDGSGATGTIRARVEIETFRNERVVVPVLPAGTSVLEATVDGKPVPLVPDADGPGWSTERAGRHTLNLTYQVDAVRSGTGYVMSVPLPRAAATQLTATLPAGARDPSVIPAAGVRVRSDAGATRVEAAVPATRGVQIAWRSAGRLGHSVSRAGYVGRLQDDAVRWRAAVEVDLFTDEATVLPLLPASVALEELKVDGKPMPILVEDERFAVWIQGRGHRRIDLDFQTPVVRDDGPPRLELAIPRIPVTRFDLTLPGSKRLSVEPAASVTAVEQAGTTRTTVHVPMTNRVTFSWSEAVPDEVEAESRANAVTVHVVHAEEGVLYVRARLRYEISRGETSRIALQLPEGVQVERIADTSGNVADWRVGPVAPGSPRRVDVFLDHPIRGALDLEVTYDRSLRDGDEQGRLEVPLIWIPEAQRQRGMVALLSGSSLALRPLAVEALTRVGEDRLPPEILATLDGTVAHTYKYAEERPRLLVEPTQPERIQGRFDTQIDTLVSLGEATLTGSAGVEVNVKSGKIMGLDLRLPSGVNLLHLTGPSVRTHRVGGGPGEQTVAVEFTRDMEGRFRLDATYERILRHEDDVVEIPTLTMPGSEVERGRIAVEALTAVEVRTAAAEQLTPMEVGELPRALVLRTTNPILVAFRYVQTDPPPRLALNVTRHGALDVQEAAIDRAEYHTLFTPDGLTVTRARFFVRNSRKQFLRIAVPQGAEIWSATVAGRPEKPALGDGSVGDAMHEILIKILNDTDGFPVELIYAVSGRGIQGTGQLEGTLPRPDVLVTRTRWDVYVPRGPRYGEVRANLELVEDETYAGDGSPGAVVPQWAPPSTTEGTAALPINVPAAGRHYAFEKLYANQDGNQAWLSVGYRARRNRAP